MESKFLFGGTQALSWTILWRQRIWNSLQPIILQQCQLDSDHCISTNVCSNPEALPPYFPFDHRQGHCTACRLHQQPMFICKPETQGRQVWLHWWFSCFRPEMYRGCVSPKDAPQMCGNPRLKQAATACHRTGGWSWETCRIDAC